MLNRKNFKKSKGTSLYLKGHKIVHFLYILIFLNSCDDKSSSSSHGIENFKIDTLFIDPNNEIIYLKDNLIFSELLNDSLILHNLNSELPAVEKIDLNKRKLEKIIPLAKEGPKGVGDWHIGFIGVDDSLLVLEGDKSFNFLSLQGDFIEKVRIEHLFYMVEELNGKETFAGIFISGRRIFKIVKDGVSNEFSLLVYNIDEDTHELIEIPLWQMVKSGSLIVEYPNGGKIIDMKGFSISKIHQSIMISNSTYPQIVFYLENLKETKIINPPSKFYSDVEMVEEIPVFHSQDEAYAYLAELEKRMHFLPPIWDEGSKKIFRWGYKRSAKNKEVDNPEYDNYLFVIDSAFNMEKEYHFPQIRIKPHKYFLADHKIYLYNNFDDELGFIRVWLDKL
jgi:hypothetical protein